MKQLFTLVISILIFFAMTDNNYINNNLNKYIEKDYYKNNDDKFFISSNLDFLKSNKYLRKQYSSYVKMTDNFYASNKNDLLNIYYTVLNNGWNKFSFYCEKDYTDCLKDIEELSNDSEEFSNINQLVNPYNSFSSIISNYENGRIDIEIKNKYTKEDIDKIDNKLNNIIEILNINNVRSVREKIRLFHDYIANTNVYDSLKETNQSNYNSDSSIGTLFEGHSICSGYTDTISLFLDKINVENMRISNKEHTWNAVLINNKWYNLDLTWDDPITNTGQNIIQYDYFLITTNDLKNKNEEEHYFDDKIFDFLK